jgi:hypothetical protein
MTTHTTRPRAHRSLRAGIAALLATLMAAVAVACSAPSEEPSDTRVEIPETQVGDHAAWVLEQLNGEEISDETAIVDRFEPALFESVPMSELRSQLEELRTQQPWTVTSYDGTEMEALVRITSSAAELDMSVSVGDSGRMNGLIFATPRPEPTPAADWDELRENVEAAPYEASLHVFDLGEDTPTISIGDDQPAPVGSIVKLYVLGALVEEIANGALTWDSPLTIDPEVRSLPTGELQDLPDGATVTVLEAAQKMIAISDNTATDLLIRAVGRDAVLAAMAEMGHHEPALNTPLLTTREYFWIGWGDAELREGWHAGNADQRTDLLEDVPAGNPDVDAIDWSVPAWESGVDWFATPGDIARAHAALQAMSTTDAGTPLREILSANTGLELGPEWTYAGFKGGSASGVFAGSWYLERDDGTPVIITLLTRANDPAALADTAAVLAHADDAARLLAQE